MMSPETSPDLEKSGSREIFGQDDLDLSGRNMIRTLQRAYGGPNAERVAYMVFRPLLFRSTPIDIL